MGHTLATAPLSKGISLQKLSGMARVVESFNLPLPSQPKLVLIYRSQRDGRLSWPRHYHGE